MLDDRDIGLSIKEPLMEATSPGLRMSFQDLHKLRLDALSKIQVFAYGIGHFLNDAAAALWFNFLLFFLVEVEPMNPHDARKAGSLAGLVILIGQVVDGLMTPIVGIFSDSTNTRCGKRMPWYYSGFVLMAGTLVFMFQPCRLCQLFGESDLMSLLNYGLFGALTNIGWAMCQVSHMSLVPSISLSRTRRDMLNNLRSNFTFIANLSVLVLAAIFFKVFHDNKVEFQILTYTTVTIGMMASLFFIYHIRERPLTIACRKLAKQYRRSFLKLSGAGFDADLSFSSDSPTKPGNGESPRAFEEAPFVKVDEANEPERAKNAEENDGASVGSHEESDFKWYHWFSSTQFWLYGGVYMAARIYSNIPASLLLFYLKYSLGIQGEASGGDTPFSFAVIPMLVYLSSSLISSQLTQLYVRIGRKKVFAIGALIAILIGATMLLLPAKYNYLIYGIVIVLGLSQSVILNTSIAFISEVVGMNGHQGAFVYGTYSLFEKVSNGIILWLILDSWDAGKSDSDLYLRICITAVPVAAAIFGLICTLFGKAADYQTDGEKSATSDALVDLSDRDSNSALH